MASDTPAELSLPSKINAETMPVGDNGIWEWISSVLSGNAGRIAFEAGQDAAQLSYAFAVLGRACELAGGAGALKASELAMVAKRAAEDPKDALPSSGACSWF